MIAVAVERVREGEADAASAAAGYEDGFEGHCCCMFVVCGSAGMDKKRRVEGEFLTDGNVRSVFVLYERAEKMRR